ncbi:MAG TPA: helix-turn-helix domain-containing protein [Phycisphaerae bacterium]|nr:helix-turn-helix domain-containing protein [Phycisphaerae bacterium]HNU44408.1 helix-turn-helix domain-containing protein [Phycisphaerae bacterium]
MRRTSFLESQTILTALESTLARGGFDRNAAQKRTAQQLIKRMQGSGTVSGRHTQVIALLQKGATIEQLMKACGASRRTLFRYLNHFEEAGIKIEIDAGRYRITK